jgi:hypothetical protein
VPRPAYDVRLPDPASDTTLSHRPIVEVVAGQPDIGRVAWADFARHSWYRNERELKTWIEATRGELEH